MRSLFVLVLIGALALVGTAAASTENFQNGPGMVYDVSGNPFTANEPVGITTAPFLDTFYANPYNNAGSITAQHSNSVAWTYARGSALGKASGTSYIGLSTQIYAYDSGGSLLANFAGVTNFKNANAEDMYSGIRFNVVRADNLLTLYANGIETGSNISCVGSPYYYMFTGPDELGGNFDDLVVEPGVGVVGAIPESWYVAKDIVSPSISGLYNSVGADVYSSTMHASYSIDGDPTGATLSIDGDTQVTALDTKTIQIQDKAGVYQNTIARAGIVTFNLTEFMQTAAYGRHTIVLETAEGTVEEEFWYKGVATTETSITYDRDIYAPLDDVVINSTIGTAYYVPGTYSYRAELWDMTTGLKKDTWAISQAISEHTVSVEDDLFPSSGEYMVMLYATTSGGTDILLDTDTCQVYTNKIVLSGTVYDAQQGTVISGAAVSVTQNGAETTDTTGSDGRFEIAALEKDVLTDFEVSKTGYTTFTTNFTFPDYKRYEIEVALSPSNPTHTGEAVFGTVYAYPYGSFVASPTVTILKDGVEVNSTTATAKGWYIFDGLDASTTYTIEVEKEGYLDYSNAVVTGSGGASLTQMDPWLTPTFDLTVHLVDAATLEPITALMAVSVGGQSEQTSTGTATFSNIQMGAASVAVVGSGYEANETALSMYEDQEITLYIMPLPVVPTTAIPLTPTPTPALVGMIGTVYDGMTGTAITGATVEVTAEQGGVTRTDTTDGSGDYSIANIQNGALTTVNATAMGYTHTAFSFTPAGSAEYIVDLYMYRTDESENPTIEPAAGMAGAGGTVLGGPYHELIESPTVTASNGTWSGPATLSPDHVWYFTDLEPEQAYNFTASASGYITQTVEATMGAAGSFTVVPIVLDGVYDVTITVKDADTYALILQPVQFSLSDGQTGNTSTGSYTFTNLEYATYVVAAASEGYTGGGLSFLAYGDHTEYLYLAKAPEGSDSTYEYAIPPKPVEILCRNIFGMPLAGVTVTAQGGETTLPDRDLLGAFFGWGDKYSGADLSNASMTGTTSSDGGITFMMTDALKYNLTFSDPARGISETVELMPHDTQYMFILGSMSATPAAGMPNMTLWADGAEGASPTLHGYYSDPAGTTSALYFIVERINGTVRTEVSNQSLGAVQTASPSYAVNHTTGAMYSWGFRATTPDRGAIQQWNGITLHSRLVELPIEESAYFWVSMCLVFLFAGLFSGNNIKYGFVAFPMFCGVLWYIGWLDIAGMTLGIVMVLGILMYLAKVQVA